MKHSKEYIYSTLKSGKRFAIEIKLSTNFKLYFSGDEIPEELQKSYTGVLEKQNKFDDFDQLNSKVLMIISEFESKFVEETKKKVILYSINYDENNRGQTIGFNYLVVQKITTQGPKDTDTKYYQERILRNGTDFVQTKLDNVNTYSYFDDKFMEMIWSKERELWFFKMQDSVKCLGMRLLEGFGERAEILSRKIDQGIMNQLLIGE